MALTGARRVAIEEYLFDYDVADGVVTVLVVRHVRNTSTLFVEDDEDFEGF